ncbi:Coiled-coil domain-containing protein 13 [Trebouxia sp. C0009 RCD-2024]
MSLGAEGPTEANVTFAPRLTEDRLPVTLPKDADKPLETAAADEQVRPSSPEDKPVSAGVLDLQLVPQLRELQITNQQLQQLLQQKDVELLALQELSDAAIGLKAQDVEANKVIELAKKNRSLNLALEREKQKAAGLSAELQKTKLMETVPQAGTTDPQSVEAVCRGIVQQAAAAAETAQKECAAWKSKYEAALDRCNQQEFKANLFKSERDKVSRALAKEVGDETPLSKVVEAGSEWRGRAQQISLLKAKVSELQQAQGMPAGTSMSMSTRYDSEHRRALDSMKGDRQKEVEKLKTEAATSLASLQTMAQKLDKVSARKSILEQEVKNLRDKLSVLLDKSSTDDKLIATLQVELQNLQRVGKAAKHDADLDTMLQQMESLKRKYAEQVEQVARQEQIIAAMQTMSPRSTDSR